MNINDIASPSLVLVSTFLGMLIGGVIYFFYLKNLSDLLKSIQEPNRKIAPAAVWVIFLNIFCSVLKIPIYYLSAEHLEIAIGVVVLTYLIAIFVVIWHFRVVRAVADSIEAEFDSRKIPIEHRPSYQTGMFMAVSGAITLINEVPYIGMLGSIAGLAFFIGIIAYWARTHKYKKEIKSLPEYQDEDSLIFKDLY